MLLFTIDWNMHAAEVICSFILLIYALNYILGRKQNRQMAEAWLDEVKPALADNFSVIG